MHAKIIDVKGGVSASSAFTPCDASKTFRLALHALLSLKVEAYRATGVAHSFKKIVFTQGVTRGTHCVRTGNTCNARRSTLKVHHVFNSLDKVPFTCYRSQNDWNCHLVNRVLHTYKFKPRNWICLDSLPFSSTLWDQHALVVIQASRIFKDLYFGWEVNFNVHSFLD